MSDRPNDRGLSRKHIVESCEASLRRLGVDYVDLLQCHRYDTETRPEETLRALDDLISAGKVLYAGVSEWTAGQLDAAHAIADRPAAADREVRLQPAAVLAALAKAGARRVSALGARGISQVVWSPLAQGVLTGKYEPGRRHRGTARAARRRWRRSTGCLRDDILEAVQRLGPIADGLGITMAQLALAWVLREPNVASAIVGATRPEQVDDNCAASGVELTPDALRRSRLRSPGTPRPRAVARGTRPAA